MVFCFFDNCQGNDGLLLQKPHVKISFVDEQLQRRGSFYIKVDHDFF